MTIKKEVYFYLILIIFLVLNVINISSESYLYNSKIIELEQNILNKFDNQIEVKVVIELKSRDLLDPTLSSLNNSDFVLSDILVSRDAFAGNITREGLDKLLNNSNIKSIYLSRTSHILLQSSLPLINATKVWQLGYTGMNQTICVIDTGVNYTHPNLGGCVNTNNINDGSCAKVIGGYDYYNNDANPIDDNGHGTHVAGIASANGTINGTAPYSKIIALKVCNSAGTDCPNTKIADAITWCVNNKTIYNISVITMSLGDDEEYTDGNCPIDLRTQINNAYSSNISVVISSGNGGKLAGIGHPACRGNATSVGATYDKDYPSSLEFTGICTEASPGGDNITCFTNRGTNLDLLAPGYLINSTNIGGDYIENWGTSMSAPFVAGAAALLLEKNRTLTPDQIRDILNNTGKRIPDNASGLNFSRIDIIEAINSIGPFSPDGQSCTLDSQCQSNYCDNDGVGLTDDDWCFTPYNTYFDGQETTYCEYSTNNGDLDCDEKQVGTDLDKCVGVSYREDECSSTCAETDVTSVFECTDSGCSCNQPLCDGLTTSSSIITCSAGETWFGDQCTSTAGGEDSSNNICRSSTYAVSCTADSQCNGVELLTNKCNEGCIYDIIPPNVNIISPINQIYNTTKIEFNVSLNEKGKWCNFSLDGSQNISMTKFNNTYFNFTSLNVSDGDHTAYYSCSDLVDNYNITTFANFFVDIENITVCRKLTRSINYTILNNISSQGTCLNITNNNINIDGNRYTINYSTTTTGYAVNNT
ncbi:MAG: S8 family serine peptidase, partial [Nanoarchaeota archaeon]